MKRFARGLVVGKFCPLHRGHELLIDTALASCDELVLISYTLPEFPRCGPAQREAWLEALYPASRYPQLRRLVLDGERLASACRSVGLGVPALPRNEAPAEEHRQFCGWVCLELLSAPVDAVFTSEDYGDGFAAALQGQQGRPVEHVCVDRPRQRIPASGSALRADPHGQRDRMAPEVYASFVSRIGLVGGESTGKTTLAVALAKALGTLWVPEYGRDYWVEQGGCLEYDDLLHIARQQRLREEKALGRAREYLVCDTTPLTTLSYSLEDFGRAAPELFELAAAPYEILVWCQPDFDFVQDGTRRGEGFSMKQHDWYRGWFERHALRPVIASGSPTQRVQAVLDALK